MLNPIATSQVRNLNSSDGSAAQAMVLAERAEGDAPDSRFVFLNDLSIDPETGVAIISESTRVYPRRRVALALFDGHADGRLLAMLPGATLADVRVIVLQDGLFFPNGVQLVPKQPGRPLSVLVRTAVVGGQIPSALMFNRTFFFYFLFHRLQATLARWKNTSSSGPRAVTRTCSCA